ncbi:MAG: 1-acyl-sn-glycerol-3-phosphate acyltransferase [Bacteroidales bacterium]|nr:1-acyl-sn-glycerol-3-phosphate acyltransferase [Bacteroidales bacterium]
MKNSILYTYTLLSYTLLYPFTFLITLTVLVFYHMGLRKQIPAVIWFWATGSFLLIGKYYRIEGRENFDKRKKYILVSNHSSLFDIMGIMAICSRISWFGRANLMQIPVFGNVLRAINYVPMQTIDLKNTKNMMGQLINNSESQTVAIFPEGTRTTTGDLSRFRKGFLHVLKASQLDILPVTLNGFFEFKPKNRFYFNYPIKLSARIHPPITYNELQQLDDSEIIARVRNSIESALY